jgi:Spy/CpxP family protein refolding chaperone
MFGFLLGSVCLVGLIKVLRGGRCGSGGWQRGCGGQGQGWYGGHGGHHGWHGRHHGRGGDPRRRMRWAFARLGTTVAQEQELLAAFDKMQEVRENAREQMQRARGELAAVLRAETFDEEATGALTARIEALVDEGRKAGLDALATAHRVLDVRQRGILADFLDGGGFFGENGRRGGAHPFRGDV